MTGTYDQASIGQSWSAPTNSGCHSFGDAQKTYHVKLHGFEEGGTLGFKRGIPTQYYEVGNRLIADNSSRTKNNVNAIRVCVLDGKPEDVAFEISREYGISSLKALSLTVTNPKPAAVSHEDHSESTSEENPTIDYFELLSRDALETGLEIPETGKVVIQGVHANRPDDTNQPESNPPKREESFEPMEVDALVKVDDERSDSQLSSSSSSKISAPKAGTSAPDKAKHKMMRELMALGAVDLGVINDGPERIETVGDCRNPECLLGCVCHSIKGAKPLVSHCGKVECMLDGCTCKGESYKNGKDSKGNTTDENHLFAICQTRAHYGMATQEYNSVAKFVRTPDGSCRTIERDKRERRVPIRYQDDSESERSARIESIKQKQDDVKRRQDVVKTRKSPIKNKELKTTASPSDLRIDDLQRHRQDLVERKAIKSSTVLLPMGRISQPSNIGIRAHYHPRRSAPEPVKETSKRVHESSFHGRVDRSLLHEDSPECPSAETKIQDVDSSVKPVENLDREENCQRTQEYSWKRSESFKYPPRWWSRRILPEESYYDFFTKIGVFNDTRRKIFLKKYPKGSTLFIRWDIFVQRVANNFFNVTGMLSRDGIVDLFINKEGGISLIQLMTRFKVVPGHVRKLHSGQIPADSHNQWAILKKVDSDWKWLEILMAPQNKTSLTEPPDSRDRNKSGEPNTRIVHDSEEVLVLSSDDESKGKESSDEPEIIEVEATKSTVKNLFSLKIRVGLPVPIRAPETKEANKVLRKMDLGELKRRRLSNNCIIPEVIKPVNESEHVEVSDIKETQLNASEVFWLPKENFNPPFLDPPTLNHSKIVQGLNFSAPPDKKARAIAFADKLFPLDATQNTTRLHLGQGFALLTDNQVSIPILEQDLRSLFGETLHVFKNDSAPTEKDATKAPENGWPTKLSKTHSSMEIRRKVIMARMKSITDIRDRGSSLDSNILKENLRAHVFKLKSRKKPASSENKKAPVEERKQDRVLGCTTIATKISLAEKPQVENKSATKQLVAKEDLLSTG